METKGEVIVSYHAAMRWLERAEGIDLEPFRKRVIAGGFDPTSACNVLCEFWKATRVSFDDIAFRILAPEVRLAVLSGHQRIRVGGAVIVAEGRVIRTVLATKMCRYGLEREQRFAGSRRHKDRRWRKEERELA
jgi:hypothetical protein